MRVEISVEMATSSIKYRWFPLNILLILSIVKINNYHFFKLHILKYRNTSLPWNLLAMRNIDGVYSANSTKMQ